jgi:hypothetical protein
MLDSMVYEYICLYVLFFIQQDAETVEKLTQSYDKEVDGSTSVSHHHYKLANLQTRSIFRRLTFYVAVHQQVLKFQRWAFGK